MKVLVTAFKPFGKCTNNYSEEVLTYIRNVDKVVLDVCYDKCYQDLTNQYNLDDYDLIISLGEARMRRVLTLETTAKNISSCSLADNNGIVKKGAKIIDNDIVELKTLVNLENVIDIVELSHDAGKFVCNNIYFHLLNNYPTKSLFVHIPECNDNICNYLEYASTINKIIDKIRLEVDKNKLFTIDSKGYYNSKNNIKLSLLEYSEIDIEGLLKEANKYYVKFYLYSYETDMSDSSETTRNEIIEISKDNIIIKDNRFYGCLCWSNSYYQSHGTKEAIVVTLDKNKYEHNDYGGYNEHYYSYTLLEK